MAALPREPRGAGSSRDLPPPSLSRQVLPRNCKQILKKAPADILAQTKEFVEQMANGCLKPFEPEPQEDEEVVPSFTESPGEIASRSILMQVWSAMQKPHCEG